MTCRELVELVTDYLDGALDQTERARFEDHLTVCSDCEHYLAQIRVTLRLAHNITTLEQRPEVVSLLDAFRDWHCADGPVG